MLAVQVEKYMVENKLCLALVHPNIVRYFGLSIQYPNVALVFELCDRGSLYQIIVGRPVREGVVDPVRCRAFRDSLWRVRLVQRFSVERKIKLALDGARSLQYLHSFDPPYIHRDVKVGRTCRRTRFWRLLVCELPCLISFL